MNLYVTTMNLYVNTFSMGVNSYLCNSLNISILATFPYLILLE